jgi:hypothetical protein
MFFAYSRIFGMHGLLGVLVWCLCRLEQALQDCMKDFADRMKEITASLGGSSDGAAAEGGEADAVVSLAEKEQLCDELMEIVENIDYARGG